MKIPLVRGIIERRILVNYRVDPRVMAAILPPPFRPKLVQGWSIGGICLIRLGQIRPAGLPPVLGLSSENAAHRVAVEWDDAGQSREGVFVPRRDTDSCLTAMLGGRVFSGFHHHARFNVEESDERIAVSLRSDDGHTEVEVAGRVAAALPKASVFASI